MYQHINKNNLLSPNQSGFRTRDSCINQLLPITHDIYHSLDEGFETKVIFLDILKDFGKIWPKELMYKLCHYGFSVDLLSLFIDILNSKKQRLVLNGQHSSWADIKGGVPKESILRPFFEHKWPEWKFRLKFKTFWRWHILIFHS